MQFNFPHTSLSKLVSIVGTIGALVGGFLAFDARYNPAPIQAQLEAAKTELITELRTEIAITRAAMLSNMLREADDIEYQISEYELNNKQPPRFLVEKHKQIIRDIEELKSHAENSYRDN